MVNHPSYKDRNGKLFSVPVKKGGLSILLPEDRANDYEKSILICRPLQNHNALDAEFHHRKNPSENQKKKNKAMNNEKVGNQRSHQ